MIITEKQIHILIGIAETVRHEYKGLINDFINQINEVLEEIRNQQSDELKNIE